MKGKLSDRQENNQERHNQHQLSISDHHPTPQPPPRQPQQADEITSSAPFRPNITPSQGVRRPSHGTPTISPPCQEMYRRQPCTAFPTTTALPTSRFSRIIGAPYWPWATPHQLSISDHQQTLPPPPPQPQQAEATPDLAFTYFCYQPGQPPQQLQQAEATPDLVFSYFSNQPTPPPVQPQPSHATPRIDARFQEMYQQPSTAFPPTNTLPTAPFSTPVRMPQPPYEVPSQIQRLNPEAQRQNKNYQEAIMPPHPWATDRLAKVHTYAYLLHHNINMIEGSMQCSRCTVTHQRGYDLTAKLADVAYFIVTNENRMGGKAGHGWNNPTRLRCKSCEKRYCVWPKIEMKKRDINWLFLFLGHWIGCCSIEQLKYFCKHNGYDQQGSKAHLVYRTYIGLYEQLRAS